MKKNGPDGSWTHDQRGDHVAEEIKSKQATTEPNAFGCLVD